MFERFTPQARAVVVAAQEHARRLHADQIEATHLLLAMTDPDSGITSVLAARGVTADGVEQAVCARSAPSAPDRERDQDAQALRALGIDLDRIRDSIEATFGPGALDRARRKGRRRAGWPVRRRDQPEKREQERFGGHLGFSSGAKKSLGLALREAIRLSSKEIRSEHLALGMLRSDDDRLREIMVSLGVDGVAVRADLESRLRRSA